MFYKQDDIEGELKCQLCQKRYEDARVLPCSESLCHMCIVNNLDGDVDDDKNRRFRCVFCGVAHEMPENGFIKNGLISKLAEKRAVEVRRGVLMDQLKSLLVDLDEKLTQLNADLNSPLEAIEKHCTTLRNQVELAAESIFLQIDKFKHEYLTQIDEYERTCVSGVQRVKDVKDINELEHIEEFRRKASALIIQPEFEEELVRTHISSANDYLENLNSKLAEVNELNFNFREFEFTPNRVELRPEDLGLLGFNIHESQNDRSKTKNNLTPETLPIQDDYTKVKCFNLKKIYDQLVQKYCVHQMDEKNFVLLMINSRSILTAVAFDRSGKNLTTKKGDNLVHRVKMCRQFISATYGRKIFVVHDCHEMMSLSGMLQIKYEARSPTSVQLIAANRTSLFCLCNNEIYEYNHRLRRERIITLAESELVSFKEKYASNVVSGLKCTDTYLYLNVSTSLYIFDLNGSLMSVFNLGLSELSITTDLVVTFDKQPFQLDIYDEEMNLIKQIQLNPDKKRAHLKMIDSIFDQLLFVDTKSSDFFIYERHVPNRVILDDDYEDECYGSNSSHRTDSSLCDTFEWIPVSNSFLKQ